MGTPTPQGGFAVYNIRAEMIGKQKTTGVRIYNWPFPTTIDYSINMWDHYFSILWTKLKSWVSMVVVLIDNQGGFAVYSIRWIWNYRQPEDSRS